MQGAWQFLRQDPGQVLGHGSFQGGGGAQTGRPLQNVKCGGVNTSRPLPAAPTWPVPPLPRLCACGWVTLLMDAPRAVLAGGSHSQTSSVWPFGRESHAQNANPKKIWPAHSGLSTTPSLWVKRGECCRSPGEKTLSLVSSVPPRKWINGFAARKANSHLNPFPDGGVQLKA